jgi:galactokinase
MAAEALQGDRWERVGRLMYASHDSLRDDYEVSCDELDLMVELAKELGAGGGVIGSRMTGGGFGGCTVTLVNTDSAAKIADTLHEKYQKRTGIEPSLFTSRPAQGARVLKK